MKKILAQKVAERYFLYLSIIGSLLLSPAVFAQNALKKEKVKGADFNIALIPDIQYYTAETRGGTPEMFRAQIRWIRQNYKDSSIVYVVGLGDNVDDSKHGVPLLKQWENVKDNGGFYDLEKPLPGMPHGIPYGIALGNHDQADTVYKPGDPNYHGRPGLNPVRNTSIYYNQFFGVDHFKDKPYYGGHANILGKNNNDCHFDHFSVSGQEYIVVYLPYDESYEDKNDFMIQWADSLVKAYPKAKAIVVSHGMLKWGPLQHGQNPWNNQGLRLYEGLKRNKNILFFLCGHVKEGYREEVFDGHKIRIFMSDYQGQKNGGDGKMRIMKVNTQTDSVSFRTFSPYYGES